MENPILNIDEVRKQIRNKQKREWKLRNPDKVKEHAHKHYIKKRDEIKTKLEKLEKLEKELNLDH